MGKLYEHELREIIDDQDVHHEAIIYDPAGYTREEVERLRRVAQEISDDGLSAENQDELLEALRPFVREGK